MSVEKQNKTFIHHVFFYLNHNDEESLKKFMEGLNFLATAPTIQSYHIGVPAATNRDVIINDYTVSWCCFFENAEAEVIYQTDPIHLEFIDRYKSMWSKVVVYDSETIKNI
jgi:hypothetical protein